ncbi:MAG TPA: ATP-binding protein [Ktedonobacterales bacterium]
MRAYGTLPPNITGFTIATSALLSQTAQALTGARLASVALLDDASGELIRTPMHTSLAESVLSARVRQGDGLEGWVLARVEPALVPHTGRDPRTRELAAQGFVSAWCVPLLHEERLLGTLLLLFPFSQAEITEAMRLASQQTALLIAQHQRNVEASRQTHELNTLLEAARALTSTLDPTALVEQIATNLRALIACDRAIIYIYDPHFESLRMMTSLGPSVGQVAGAVVSMTDDHSIAVKVARSGRPLMFSPGESQMGAVTEIFLAGEMLNLLCTPLISKDVLVGVVMLARQRPFSTTDLATLTRLGSVVAAMLENVELYQEALAGRERLEAMYAAASDAIAVTDGRQRLIEVNHAFASLVGASRESLIAQPCEQVLSMAGRQLFGPEGALTVCLRDGLQFSGIECVIERPTYDNDRAVHYLDFAITPIEGPEGRRALLLGRDVTAKRENEHLRAQLLDMIAHEMAGPLGALSGYLSRTLDGHGGSLTAAQLDYLRHAQAIGETLTAPVDDIKELMRNDNGKFSLDRKPLDIGALALQAVDEQQVIAEDAVVTLRARVQPHVPPVLADQQRMRQVLRNLISNALKFTPLGGQVTVTVGAQDSSVYISVADTGMGIADEHQARIFDRYYQVPRPGGSGRSRGQGLGLAIVRLIAESHGGAVWVESIPGQGSTFTVRLPIEG